MRAELVLPHDIISCRCEAVGDLAGLMSRMVSTPQAVRTSIQEADTWRPARRRRIARARHCRRRRRRRRRRWRRRQRRRRRRRQLHERVLVAWHCGLVRAARGRGVRRVRSACCRGGRERRVAGGWGLPGGRRGKAQGGCRAGTHAVDIVVLHDRRRSAVRSPARHRPLHVRPKRLSRPRRGRGPAHQPRRRHGCRRLWRMRQRRQGRRQRAARPRRACPGC
jgi:hypothetical protein